MADDWSIPSPTVVVEGDTVTVYPPGSVNAPKPKPKTEKPKDAAAQPGS